MTTIKAYQSACQSVERATADLAHAERDWQHTKNTPRAKLFWVRLVKAQRTLIKAKRAEVDAYEQMVRENNKLEKKHYESAI